MKKLQLQLNRFALSLVIQFNVVAKTCEVERIETLRNFMVFFLSRIEITQQAQCADEKGENKNSLLKLLKEFFSIYD